MLSILQIRKLTHLFHLHDENGNGYVEQADYERLIDRFLAQHGRTAVGAKGLRAVWMAHWAAMAAGEAPLGSGHVPLDGWLALWNAILQVSFDDRVLRLCEHLFAGMDIDGDGKITADENRGWFEVFGLDPADAAAAFAACDLNGDGFITGDEWLRLVEQFFYSDDPTAPGNLLFGVISESSESRESRESSEIRETSEKEPDL